MPVLIILSRVAPLAGALLGGLALAGCGAAPTAPSTAAVPTSAAAPAALPTTAPAPVTATDGTNYAACRDGRCVVEVRAGTSIRFDPSLRISTLRVESVDGDRVSFASTFPSGGSGSTSGGTGGSGRVNGVSYRILDVRDGTAVLEFTPG